LCQVGNYSILAIGIYQNVSLADIYIVKGCDMKSVRVFLQNSNSVSGVNGQVSEISPKKRDIVLATKVAISFLGSSSVGINVNVSWEIILAADIYLEQINDFPPDDIIFTLLVFAKAKGSIETQI